MRNLIYIYQLWENRRGVIWRGGKIEIEIKQVGNYHSMRDRNKLRAVQMIVRKWSKFMLVRPFAKWRQNAVEFAEWRQKVCLF